MLIYFVVAPILMAVFMYLYTNDKIAKIVAILVQGTLFVGSFNMFLTARYYTIETVVGGYESVAGITLRASVFNSALIIIATLVFLMITIYNFPEPKSKMFWLLMFIWEGALIGIFLTGDFFNRFVLMEVATIVSTILIMYNREERSMYDGLYYLVINVVSVQFFLFGVGYIYRITGTLDMYRATAIMQELPQDQLLLPYALIMVFAAMKCALFPISNWMSKTLATPGSPPTVNAVMASVHMVSGLYLFMSMHNVFSHMQLNYFFIIMGAITSLVAIVFGLAQRNIMKLLSYVAVVQFGLVIIALNIGGYYNQLGAMYHVVNYALFSAILFLGIGLVIARYNTTNINNIRGVLKVMPITAFSLIFAILGIIGTPLFSGSVSTYFMLRYADIWIAVIVAIISLGNFALFARFSTILLGTPTSNHSDRNVANLKFKAIPLLPLAIICLVGGIFGDQVIGFLLNTEASVSPAGIVQKLIMFAISAVLGFGLHKATFRTTVEGSKPGPLCKIRGYDMGFRGIVLSVGIFFGIILTILFIG